MTVSLTNTSGRCQVFVLAHETYCKALGGCTCTQEPGRAGRRVARSLTLASGATVARQPDAVLAIPEVVRAVQRGELAVQRHSPDAPAASAPPPAPAFSTSAPPSAPAGRAGKKKRGAA